MVHSVVNEYCTAGIKVRRDESSEEHRQSRDEYCAHLPMTRTLSRENLGRSVTLIFKKKREEVETAFPQVFTKKIHAEFDLKYGVRPEKATPVTTSAQGPIDPAKAKENSVSITKKALSCPRERGGVGMKRRGFEKAKRKDYERAGRNEEKWRVLLKLAS